MMRHDSSRPKVIRRTPCILRVGQLESPQANQLIILNFITEANATVTVDDGVA